jgi:uncharacterized protein
MAKKIKCKNCGYCCNYITISLDTPEDKEDYDEIVWFLLHENIKVYIDNDDSEGDEWYVEIQTPCKAQDEENKCKIYRDRPDVCREYDTEECDTHGEGTPYKLAWTDKDDFIAYLKMKGIVYKPGE